MSISRRDLRDAIILAAAAVGTAYLWPQVTADLEIVNSIVGIPPGPEESDSE